MIAPEARPLAVHVGEITSRMEADSNGGGVAVHCGAQPMARRVQRHGSADAEMRPQHRADESNRDRAVDPGGELDVVRHAGQLAVHRIVVCEQQWRERRRRRDDRVAEATRDLEPAAVAAGLGQRLAAGGENDRPGAQVAARRRDGKLLVVGDNVDDAPIRAKLAADARQLAEQRVEHVARSIRVGEQLAVALLVKRDADFAEEGDRLVDGKRAEDAPDDRRSAAPEIAFGDVDVGHVAARSAADHDFCAGFLRAVEDDDGTGRVRSPEEDGGREAGGAGADDDYVVPCHSTAKRPKSAAKPRIIDSMPDPCAGLAGAPIDRSSSSVSARRPAGNKSSSDWTSSVGSKPVRGVGGWTAGAAIGVASTWYRSMAHRSTRARDCASGSAASARATCPIASTSAATSSAAESFMPTSERSPRVLHRIITMLPPFDRRTNSLR